MGTVAYNLINLNDGNPAAPAGNTNAKFQESAPYSKVVTFNNVATTVTAVDVSCYVPSAGSGGSVAAVFEISLAPSAAGNFTIAHGAPSSPIFVLIQMTSGGEIWLQSPTGFDATNLYLAASAAGVTGTAFVFISNPDQIVSFTSSAPGNFSVAHTIGSTPALVLIEMDSGGAVWFQTPGADSSNVYLTASDTGIKGRVIIWKSAPILTIHSYREVSLAPSAPGNFTVAHGAGALPIAVIIKPTSGGAIWLQSPTGFDATNLYLVASDAGVTAKAEVWT